jgi:hypothetical protein
MSNFQTALRSAMLLAIAQALTSSGTALTDDDFIWLFSIISAMRPKLSANQ